MKTVQLRKEVGEEAKSQVQLVKLMFAIVEILWTLTRILVTMVSVESVWLKGGLLMLFVQENHLQTVTTHSVSVLKQEVRL